MPNPEETTAAQGAPEAPRATRRSIVVGFDGSDQSRDALALATRLADGLNAELTAANIYPHGRWEAPPLGFNDWMQFLRDDAEKALEEVLEVEPRAHYVITSAIPSPSAAEGLSAIAEEKGADFLVIGSSHVSRVGHVLAGSVGERLLHGATCPVVVAPQGYRDRPDTEIGSVIAGYDASAESGIALEAAADLALALGIPLKVYGVVSPAPFIYEGKGELHSGFPDLARARVEQVRRNLDAALEALPEGIDAEPVLREGDPVEILSEAGRDAGLLVIGSRAYGPLRRVLLGDISSGLVRSAPCPVAVFPRGLGGGAS